MGSPCSCIDGKFDFHITEVGCSKNLYTDLSLWVQGDSYVIPDTYQLIAKNEDSGAEIKLVVNGHGVTQLPEELKDGVYTFSATTCDKKYKRIKAVTARLQCCLDQYVVSNDFEEGKYMEAQRLLNGVKIMSEFNKLAEVKKLYKMVERLIKNLNCNC